MKIKIERNQKGKDIEKEERSSRIRGQTSEKGACPLVFVDL